MLGEYWDQRMTRRLNYNVVVRPLSPEDGGGYLATVPDLPGCMSDGATEVEALDNVEDAIRCWIDDALFEGRKVPEPDRFYRYGT
jgi:antitoxin HicB